ncbi:LysM domain-containing protein [Desulfosporosinus sp. Sb-LF]|uniref:LysM peptidoglycan-binding domain-containing protein n=1 Tax=Desulfosporosinus sp. Sb-LF TaxID=2560027 RepID=UPI0032B71C73
MSTSFSPSVLWPEGLFLFFAQALRNHLWHNLECSQKEGVYSMYHHVRKGETLHHIARHHRTHVHHLISLNPHIKNPHLIYPGQKIRVHK